MIKTRQASTPSGIEPSWMFMGDSGTGKTTLLAQAAKFFVKKRGGKFLIVNCEPRTRTDVPEMLSCPPEVEICDQPGWEAILEIFTTGPSKYKAGIGIDGFQRYCMESFYDILGIASKPRFNIGQTHLGHQNAWHIFGERMANHFDNLVQKNMPLIVTTLPKYDKDEVSGEIFKAPIVAGKTAILVPPLFTVVGLCRYKGGSKEAWSVDFRPDRGFPARDTTGVLAPTEPANFEHLYTKLTNKVVLSPPDSQPEPQPKVG